MYFIRVDFPDPAFPLIQNKLSPVASSHSGNPVEFGSDGLKPSKI